MKPVTLPFFLLTILSFSPLAYGGTLREIELIDGSIIKAQVLSMDGKTYRLRSETLGEVELPEYRIKAIREARPASSQEPQPATPSATQVENNSTVAVPGTPSVTAGPSVSAPSSAAELQHAFSQDPDTMKKVLSLQDDPLVQDILSDEQLMQAIHSGNLGILMNDPRMQELMSHPTVQDLSNQYGR